MKRIISYLVIFMVFSIVSVAETINNDNPNEYVFDDYTYSLLEDGSAVIIHWDGFGSKIDVPQEIDGHTVSWIGDSAFANCYNIESITLPDSVVRLGTKAFINCHDLESVHFSKCLEDIESECFSNTGVWEVWLPEGIKNIGANSFSNTPLKDLYLPSTLEKIGDYAFSNCINLREVELPESIIQMGANPFLGSDRLEDIQISPDHPYLAKIEDVLFSKDDRRLIWYPPKKDIEEYNVPEGIKIIGNCSFYGYHQASVLKHLDVTLPDSVEVIEEAAFYNCESLYNLTLSANLKIIGDYAFDRCRVTTFTNFLPNNVEKIGSRAFRDCDRLKSVEIPLSVKEIGENPFEDCNDLQAIEIPQNHQYFETIDGMLISKTDHRLVWYSKCSEHNYCTVPEGIQIIGGSAYYYCDKLESVAFPESVVSLSDFALYNCSSISEMVLPNGLVEIGSYTFAKCDGLVELTLPEGLQKIGDGAFWMCENIKTLTVPESVVTIGDDAFANCSNLTIVVVRGSCCEEYCKHNGLDYAYADTNDWLKD